MHTLLLSTVFPQSKFVKEAEDLYTQLSELLQETKNIS